MYWYCKVATSAQKKFFASRGYPNAAFSPNQKKGIHTVTKMLRRAATMLGLGDKATGHVFRRMFVTTIVNAPGVSAEEALATTRHNSVAAQRPYMVRGNTSEANKMAALGFVSKKAAVHKFVGKKEDGDEGEV